MDAGLPGMSGLHVLERLKAAGHGLPVIMITGNADVSMATVAMKAGALLRFEEITRCVPDVQDALVSIMSDKTIAIPELPDSNTVFAKPGFNIIATANSRDQGGGAVIGQQVNQYDTPAITFYRRAFG